VAKRAATQERLPSRVDLQLARLVPAAPEGREWLHEVKFDGYRVLLWRSAERVRISSRGDQDWTAKLPATARAARNASVPAPAKRSCRSWCSTCCG
jgi:bifunctional non-homologous end joining protein LigD